MKTVNARVLSALAFCLAALTLITPALAAEPFDADVQNFKPAMDSRSFITVERSKVLGTLEPTIGLFLNYAFEPLVQDIGGETQKLIEGLGTADLVLAIGFGHWVEIGVDLPLALSKGDTDGPGDTPTYTGEGFGDPRFSMKIRILDRDEFPVGIALVPQITIAGGTSNAFISHGQTPVLTPKLVIDWMMGSRLGAAINLGATLREVREISAAVTQTAEDGQITTLQRDDPIVFGQSFDFRFGLGFQAVPERLELVFETYGSVPLESDAARAMPLETLLGLRYFLNGNSFLTLGATRGWMNAYGDPAVRPFAGIVFEPTRRDRDGDGLYDDIDKCPDEAEDRDEYEDEDGCPDPDNDMDGIPDLLDQCPNLPEDINGFEDDDGCPDKRRDRDRDGILDTEDRCPDRAEDKDGFQDSDGCPDPDNDNDGIPDTSDQCPNEAEDYDGFRDEDGCPDTDNDDDGIPDAQDKCPNVPGSVDNNGCPVQRKVVISGGKLRILDKVYFETAKDVIKQESYGILYQVAETLRQNPQIKLIEVQGHTDARGRDSYNMDLSNKRAAAVRTFLMDKGDVTAKRLISKGYGETLPIDDAENQAAWSKNRRVEFIILKEDTEGGE
jgi:outer membrane protein OmpA-like peptidoglycan-associated protein